MSGRLKPLFGVAFRKKNSSEALSTFFSKCIEVALDFRHAKYLAKNLKLSKESFCQEVRTKSSCEDDSVAFFQGRGLKILKAFLATVSVFLPS